MNYFKHFETNVLNEVRNKFKYIFAYFTFAFYSYLPLLVAVLYFTLMKEWLSS